MTHEIEGSCDAGGIRDVKAWLGGCCHCAAGEKVQSGIHGTEKERADVWSQQTKPSGKCDSAAMRNRGEDSSVVPGSNSRPPSQASW